MNWQPVRSHEDVEQLLKHFGGFRMSWLREAHIWSDQYMPEGLLASQAVETTTTVRVLVQRPEPEPSAIEMLFERVQDFHRGRISSNFELGPPLKLRSDGIFYWRDLRSNIEWGRDITWVTAQALSWRDASDWIGGTLRYGPDH